MNPFLKSIIRKHREKLSRLASDHVVPAAVLEGVREEWDIPYLPDGDPAHRMDLYRPNTLTLPAPVIFYIHGGGLIAGTRKQSRHFCINLCKMGYIVFSVSYRLCPETNFFGQLEDIYAAMNCIDGMIPELKAERGRCYMAADGAGALLALYASAIQRNPQLAKASGLRPSYLEIGALALISGMFYTTRIDPIGLVMAGTYYGAGYRSHPFYRFLNPNREEVSMYLPPCLLFTSRHDALLRHSYYLTAVIRQYEGKARLYDYGKDPRLVHTFAVCEPELPESMEVIGDIAAFITEHK